MSVKELEKSIATLPPGQFLKLADWFDGYRTSLGLRVDHDESISPKLRRELKRRISRADAHPEELNPWDGTTDQIRLKLNEIRRKKTSRG